MRIVKDYNELDKIAPIEGGKVLVMYSNLIHQFINGRWSAVGRLDKDGRIHCIDEFSGEREKGHAAWEETP